MRPTGYLGCLLAALLVLVMWGGSQAAAQEQRPVDDDDAPMVRVTRGDDGTRAQARAPDEGSARAARRLLEAAFADAEIDIERAGIDGPLSPEAWQGALRFAIGVAARLAEGEVAVVGERLFVAGRAAGPADLSSLEADLATPPGAFAAVDGQVEPPLVSRFTWQARRTGDEVIVVGHVASRAMRQRIGAALSHRFAALSIDDRTTLAGNLPPDGWLAAVLFAVDQLARLETGVVALSGAELTISGRAASDADLEALQDARARPPAGYDAAAGTIRPPRGAATPGEPELAVDSAPTPAPTPAPDRPGPVERERQDVPGDASPTPRATDRASDVPDDAAERADAGDARGGAVGGQVAHGQSDAPQETAEPDREAADTAAADCEADVAEMLRNEPITFASGRTELAAGGGDTVERLAAELVACTTGSVMLSGYTDSEGSAELNLELSFRRAAAVAELLVANGLAADRITAVGHGESRPVADNATAEGRARNRRIEVVLRSGTGGARSSAEPTRPAPD